MLFFGVEILTVVLIFSQLAHAMGACRWSPWIATVLYLAALIHLQRIEGRR